MKKNQLTILAASLVAAFAVNGAYAGQINSSSVTLAREVIESNSQVVRAPSKSYSFAGDLDARFNAQRLQVQLTLPGTAKWGNGPFTAGTVTISNSNGVSPPLGADAVTPVVYTAAVYVTADNKTLYANIDVPMGANNIITQPIITFNPGTVVGTNNSGITNLKSVALDTACVAPDTFADVTFKHYTTYTSPALMTGTNLDSEDSRTGATNTGRLLNFTENLKITTTPSAGTLNVDNATQMQFTGTGAAFVSATLANLGTVRISNVGSGLDLDYATVYGAAAGPATLPATAVAVNGTIEAKALNVTVSLPNGVANGTLSLNAAANCAGAVLGTVPTVFGATSAVIPVITAANISAVYNANAYVCYDVSPQTSLLLQTSISNVNDLLKAAPSSNSATVDSLANGFQEQKNTCSGTLTPIGGGVKVDVRNYATSKTAGNWSSVIRIINPSETNTAKVYGQLIHADGTYGGWGVLQTTLAPRAAVNMTSAQIDALLTNAPVNNGAGYVAGAVAPAASGVGDRLRITADGVGSLRVQNYLYNPDSKNFIEASSTQGVDFDAPTLNNRAPDISQTVVQDAQRGIAK